MKIVTGMRGTPHITSNDVQGFNQGVTGEGSYVLPVGNKFNATAVNETLTIEDGEGVMQGVHFRIPPGETDDITFDVTAAGYTRIDLLCARYTKDVGTGYEAVDWHVIEGTPSSSTPSAPSATSGDILGGDTVADFPMWKITVGSSGVTNVSEIFHPGATWVEAEVTLNSLNKKVSLGTYEKGTYLVAGSASVFQSSGSAGTVEYGYEHPDISSLLIEQGFITAVINNSRAEPISFVVVLTSAKEIKMYADPSSTSLGIKFGVYAHVVRLA